MMRQHLLFLVFICLVSTMGGLLFGYDITVISGTQEVVAGQFQLSSAMQGQYTNMAILGCLLGVFATMGLGDRFSRKALLIQSSLMLLLSAIWCAFAGSVSQLFMARLIGGLGVGIASVVSPLYISEATPPHFRGRMVTLFQLMINTGIVLAALTNSWLQSLSERAVFQIEWVQRLFADELWRGMFLMEAIPASAFFLLCLVIPHSPRWLVKEGRMADAESVLRRLRSSERVPEELAEIREAVSHEEGSFKQLFAKGLRKGIFIGLFLAVIGDLSGITAVVYYGPGILERAGFARGGAMNGFVVIALFLLFGTLLASWIVDRVGRKPLLYASTTGCVVTLISTGLLLNSGADPGMLLVSLICGFAFSFGVGLGPIKFVIITEIFPTRLRGRAGAVCTQGLWLSVSLVISIFPIMRDSLGMAYCFLAFGAVLLTVYPFLFWVLPETRGRSLEVLEQMWSQTKKDSPSDG